MCNDALTNTHHDILLFCQHCIFAVWRAFSNCGMHVITGVSAIVSAALIKTENIKKG
jgi:hypothetical protein